MRASIATVLLVVTSPALACSWKERSDAEIFAAARSVFRAKVTEVRLIKRTHPTRPSENFEMVEAKFEVLEKLKGEPPPTVRDMTVGPGNCSLGLFPGWEYVLIPGNEDLVVLPTGSFGYFNPDGEDVKPRLDEFRALAKGKAK